MLSKVLTTCAVRTTKYCVILVVGQPGTEGHPGTSTDSTGGPPCWLGRSVVIGTRSSQASNLFSLDWSRKRSFHFSFEELYYMEKTKQLVFFKETPIECAHLPMQQKRRL
jgi:hypothetical protein